MQLKDLSAFDTAFDSVVGIVNTVLDYIIMAFTVLIVFIGATEDRKVTRKPTSEGLAAANGISEHDKANKGKRLYEVGALQSSNRLCVRSEPLTNNQMTFVIQPAPGKTPVDPSSETAGYLPAETESAATTDSVNSTSDKHDNGTTIPSTPALSSPRSSISIDTYSGKSTEPPWYVQEFDRINVQGPEKVLLECQSGTICLGTRRQRCVKSCAKECPLFGGDVLLVV